MNVIVIGAGASGLVASIIAKEKGDDVTLLEKENKVGRKLLMTGNGHCNMAHTNIKASDYYDDSSDNLDFVSNVLDSFSFSEFTNFFRRIGVITKDEDGYIYPASMQATTVVNALRNHAEYLGVKIKTNNEVKNIEFRDDTYFVDCGYVYECEKLIVASGGLSYTNIDSPKNILSSIQNLGLEVRDPEPALTALISDSNITKASGVGVNAKIKLLDGGEVVISEYGQIQITDYGISGIPVFHISRFVNPGNEIHIDFVNDTGKEDLINDLNVLLSTNNLSIYNLLCSLLNDKLAALIVEELDVDKESDVSSDLLEKAVSLIKDYVVKIS
ncbi:MAG: aminoacetone oxidase family FAD-binding enzyme, partial [Eubacterium sp.]|nr:aminoacetone oxidase family FAD-binding enzyme [Eubacterium sp.]